MLADTTLAVLVAGGDAVSHPIASIDCETTGLDLAADRIVELAVVRDSGGAVTVHRWLLNPGLPIPAEATAVHGITDADVIDAPRFADVAAEVYAALDGAVIVGHGVRSYDLPLLREHFKRACEPWPCEEAQVIDTMLIDRARTRHTLDAVVRRWCGREHDGAHRALADAFATLEVLRAMQGGATVADLVAESIGNRATPCGKVLWREDGAAVWGFGKVRGQPLNSDHGFARWVAGKSDFPSDVRALAARGAQGEDVRRAT